MRYDSAGNLEWDEYTDATTQAKWRGYDAAGRIGVLKTSATAPTELARYIYDADGKRVRSFVNGVEKWFVYGIGGELIAEYTPTANQSSPSKEYGYRGGEILVATETVPSFTIRRMLYDLLGSARIITDLSGSLATIERHDYLPYGEELAPTVGQRDQGWQGYGVNTQRKKFTGYERDDESGLDFAQARYYANIQGRFTSPDPLLSSGTVTDPQSWNRYIYVGNRPTIATDPDGLLWAYLEDAFGYKTWKWFGTEAEAKKKGFTAIRHNYTYIGVNGHLITLWASGGATDWGKVKRIDYQAGRAEDAHREASRMVDGVIGDFVIITLENAIPAGRAAKGGVRLGKLILEIAKDNAKGYVEEQMVNGILPKGGVYTLRDPETGEVVRSGRSKDLKKRRGDHKRDPSLGDYDFKPEFLTDNYAEQRGLEQHLHDKYDPPLNKVKPISDRNPRKGKYLRAAKRFLLRD